MSVSGSKIATFLQPLAAEKSAFAATAVVAPTAVVADAVVAAGTGVAVLSLL
ncbi:hypothetical protein [Candidatus Chlorohelix sp.]|uniref:hypothetical protein n=1 Tax=Candidatus Chlorohelix sp. TaxID=3139201 RepID=UPI00303EF578